MINRIRFLLMAVCVLSVLVGCATYDRAVMEQKSIDQTIAEKRQKMAQTPWKPAVSARNLPYLMGSQIKIRRDPADLELPVSLAIAHPITLSQAATLIMQQTGLSVQVAPSVAQRKPANAAQTAQTPPSSPRGQRDMRAMEQATFLTLANVNPDSDSIAINYTGTLRGLLDLIAAQTNTYWAYRDGIVRFFLTETRVWQINALPGRAMITSTISNSGTGGSNLNQTGGPTVTGASSQSTTNTTSLDTYKAIEEAIKTVLKQSGADQSSISSVTVDQSSGQIIVSATPPELDAVDEYVKTINEQMKKNVLIEVRVYSVSMKDNVDLSASINGVLSDLYGSTTLVSNFGASQNTPIQANQIGIGIYRTNINSNMLLKALSTVGRASLVTSGSVIALNGQPSPLQVSNSNGYLASVSTTNIPNIGSTTSLTPGLVISGFHATFLPLVRGDHIMLEYSLSLSQNLGFTTAGSGGNLIQVPNTATQTTSNRVSLKSGDTVVLTGFEQSQVDITGDSGLTSIGRNANTSRTALVITMHVTNLGEP